MQTMMWWGTAVTAKAQVTVYAYGLLRENIMGQATKEESVANRLQVRQKATAAGGVPSGLNSNNGLNLLPARLVHRLH
jgi:hypothetical protein